jgi:long-chain fatty acid transport protein
MGTAVVNDATAAYNNPAALTFLENYQIIALGTVAQFHSQFTGNVTQSSNGISQSGTSNSQSNYFLPSGYFGAPLSNRFFVGLAVLANNFNRDADQSSLLRYVMSDNNVRDIDIVPAMGVKLNDYLSVGAGLNFSQANFVFLPIAGFPDSDNADTQSHDKANATAWGGDLGVLLKPSRSTQIGFNYRSSMTYHFKGTSQLDSSPPITSNNFSFDFWTPARYVLSVNQFLSQSFGLIGTAQWIKWDIYNKINAHGIATKIGPNPVILSDVTIPLNFHNAWVYTLGGYYHLSSKWTIRMAGNYVQSPGNPNYQITQGDSIILGASMGYKLSKIFSIDAGYAHAFFQNQTINIQNSINTINGVNKAYRDSISLKITANI